MDDYMKYDGRKPEPPYETESEAQSAVEPVVRCPGCEQAAKDIEYLIEQRAKAIAGVKAMDAIAKMCADEFALDRAIRAEAEVENLRRTLQTVLEWHEQPTFKDICGFIRKSLGT